MGGKMYLGDQMVTPVIVDISLEFKDIQGSPYDNTELKNALDDKQDVIDDLEEIRNGATAGATALQPNTAITGATKCKITYDSKGLVTGGFDLNSTDITTALGYTPYNSTNPNGYQANVLEGVQVNGTDLTITNKKVNITVPTQASDIGAQPTLVSGTNIKTVNGTSLLGSGNITIDSLPAQAGNNGKFLSTDGTDASWTEIVGFTASEVQTIWESINV